MFQDRVPRKLPQRTGKHFCIRCLAETPEDQYFKNDHVCDECAREDEPAEEEEAPKGETA